MTILVARTLSVAELTAAASASLGKKESRDLVSMTMTGKIRSASRSTCGTYVHKTGFGSFSTCGKEYYLNLACLARAGSFRVGLSREGSALNCSAARHKILKYSRLEADWPRPHRSAKFSTDERGVFLRPLLVCSGHCGAAAALDWCFPTLRRDGERANCTPTLQSGRPLRRCLFVGLRMPTLRH